MGLFSNKAKPCPLCGKATPRLLPTKIQDEPLCSDCAGEIHADNELMRNWTLDDVRAHLTYRAENQKLVESFVPTRTIDAGKDIVIDDKKRLFYIKSWGESNPPVFRFDEIAGFDMKVGWEVVESWTLGMPRIPYQPPALGLASSIVAFASVLSRDDDDDKNRRSISKSETIRVMLKLSNPYLREFEVLDLSSYGSDLASFEMDFSRDMAKAKSACNIIVSMTGGTVAVPGQPVMPMAGAAAAPAADRTADDIMKFKGLLDAGVITQEEFDAKKKQLLGL